MMKPQPTYNVLVFPCGSQIAIDINFALRYSLRVKLFGASSVEDHGGYVYSNYIGGLPSIHEECFISEFNRVLRERHIDFIIPTHDTVTLFLMENQDRLESKVIASSVETARICRYKSLAYEHFKDSSFTPKVYARPEEVSVYPVFLKPDDGQGGHGTQLVHNERQLRFHLANKPNLLICEYLPGEEITVDCFTDKSGRLRYVAPRTRERTLSGISVHSTFKTVSMEIEEMAKTLNENLSFRGYWFFQAKKDHEGRYKLLEISSRFAGTSCMNIGLDVNLPLLTILDFAGIEVIIQPNEYTLHMDRAFVNRYRLDIQYDLVYVDLDDTIIINQMTNPFLLMFLFQCVNKMKKIILITKHNGDVSQTLHNFRISPELFSEIIRIGSEEHKYSRMRTDLPAILIDNSFAERMEVRTKLGIPAFDVGSIECLIDWRG